MAFTSSVGEGFLNGKVIFLAGDSRCSTDYTFYRTIFEKKTGAKVYNAGWSGATIAQFASDTYFSRLLANPHDYCFVLIGGNDTGAEGTIGTFSSDSANAALGEYIVKETDITKDYNGDTFIQALSHFLRKWQAAFADWRKTAPLTGNETEEEKAQILNSVRKPVLFLCTDLPQQRAGMPQWGDVTNQLRKNNAIKECAEKYHVHLIDLFALCNFDMSLEPEWVGPTDMVHNNGLYFMDGLHPNAYGIDVITSIEIEYLKRYSKLY